MVKSGNDFQHILNRLLLFIIVLMVFFLATVIHTMLYVLSYKAVVHYMGMKKNKAEVFAFVFSCLALTLMGYPSLSLLYYHATSSVFTDISVNMTGSQWYWSYELSNYSEDSIYIYMSRLDDLNVGDSRFMSVDNRLVLPEGARIQFYITSSDVIHGFNLPTAGVKYDAIPGVLTVVPFDAPQYGLFIGQCSEICGAGHRFMPIVVEVTTANCFIDYYIGLLVESQVTSQTADLHVGASSGGTSVFDCLSWFGLLVIVAPVAVELVVQVGVGTSLKCLTLLALIYYGA